MRKCVLTSLLLALFSARIFSQFSFDSIFHSDPFLKKVSANPDKYHLQIIYTEISYESGKLVFKDHYFNVKPGNYFYCASLVKLPVSILALRKLNEIGVPQDAILLTDSSVACHRKVSKDTSSASGFPSIEHYIKKMCLVSDNEAFGRTYEFLGVDYIHSQLQKLGFPEIRIINRYDGACWGKESQITNPVTFLDKDKKVLYRQEEQRPAQLYTTPQKSMLVGKAYFDGKKKMSRPKNFAGSNYMDLIACHALLRDLVFDAARFGLSQAQRDFLVHYLSLYPRQSEEPKYDSRHYHDSYKKYLMYGDSKAPIQDSSIIITNIVGQSYGFLSDCAYISDRRNKVEFLLSAVIYANEDEVLSDGKYDYRTVGFPYLARLGREFYKYKLQKNKDKK